MISLRYCSIRASQPGVDMTSAVWGHKFVWFAGIVTVETVPSGLVTCAVVAEPLCREASSIGVSSKIPSILNGQNSVAGKPQYWQMEP